MAAGGRNINEDVMRHRGPGPMWSLDSEALRWMVAELTLTSV